MSPSRFWGQPSPVKRVSGTSPSRLRSRNSALPLPPVVGVDVGLKQAAVVSDGRRLENQKPFALHLKKLGKLQRKLRRNRKPKIPKPNEPCLVTNYEKQRLKVARKHQQIANIRRDVQHKFTTRTGTDLWDHWPRRSQYPGDDGQSEAGRAVADAAMGQLLQFFEDQGRQCWRGSLHRLPLVSLDQTLFLLWACQEAHAPQASHLSVSGLWVDHRPGSERRLESAVVRNEHASPTSRVKLAVLESGYRRT